MGKKISMFVPVTYPGSEKEVPFPSSPPLVIKGHQIYQDGMKKFIRMG